jgi:hypothetical protein
MRKLGVIAVGSLLCFGLLVSMAQAQSGVMASAPKAVSDLDKLRLAKTYGKLPLSFEVNRGQTDRRVKFLSRGSGYNLFLTPTEAVLVLHRATANQARHSADAQAEVTEREAEKTSSTVLRMQLVGANAATRISGLQELPGKSNYFIGNDPKKWRTNVPNYGRVQIHDVYQGVDLMYYGNQRQLEDDFVVAPGADPRAITMAIAGARKVSIDAQGELVIASPGGEVRLRKPVIYQRAGGVLHEIAGDTSSWGRIGLGLSWGNTM